MLAGTEAAALLLDRLTKTPPAPAGLVSVTVPVAPCPAVTADGLMLSPESGAVPAPDGFTVSDPEAEVSEVAVTSTEVGLDTDDVDTAKVPLD